MINGCINEPFAILPIKCNTNKWYTCFHLYIIHNMTTNCTFLVGRSPTTCRQDMYNQIIRPMPCQCDIKIVTLRRFPEKKTFWQSFC